MQTHLPGRQRLAAAVTLVALVAFAACGDDDDEATDAPTTTEAPATTTTTVPEYTVQPGDNLTQIAERFGVTVDALVEANDIPNPDLLHPGEVLTIPPADQ